MRKGLLSNFLQKKRIQAVAPFLQGDILDIGCGYSEIIHLLPPQLSLYRRGQKPNCHRKDEREISQQNFLCT